MQKLAILYDASQAVLSTFDLDEVLSRILSTVRDYFNVQNAAILLLDRERQELWVRKQFGRTAELSALRVPVGQGITGSAAQLKRPVYAPDVTRDARYIRTLEQTRSELAIPLLVRNELVGVLDFQSDAPDFFDGQAIDLLTLFSTQASIALENARLYSIQERRGAQLEAINAIARQATASLEMKQLLENVCTEVLRAFPVDHVVLLLQDEGRLVIGAQCGRLTPNYPEGSVLPEVEGLCARALSTQKPVVENDIHSALHGYLPGFHETRSEIALPLISAGTPLGVLTLESAAPGAFQPGDVQALESVADIVATALKSVHYVEQVKQMAYRDGLTGIHNRRYFEQRILEELERTQRYESSMAVVMLDIDHFKNLNDEFGHLLGDEVLRQVSQAFTQQLRKVDVLCRYGGEEFAVILPETTGENAFGVAEKLRRAIAAWVFPGVPRPVTVSAGIAEYPHQGTTRDQLVRAADEALYAAKQAGRNRVVAASTVARAADPA
jgi:diguanylate cyclase (GGDEF)-like protein